MFGSGVCGLFVVFWCGFEEEKRGEEEEEQKPPQQVFFFCFVLVFSSVFGGKNFK